jgi:O-antigen ligase
MEWSTDYGEKGSARNALRIAAITGVLAAPSAILLVDGLGTPYLGICALAGLLIVAKQGRLFLTDWRKAGVLLWFGILMLAYLLVTLANFALVDSSTFAFSRVQRQLLLLSIPVVFALLWWARPTLQVVASGIAVNAVVFGVYTMFSVLPGRERGVGLGVTHETLFGNAGLLLGFASLALILLKPSWPWRILGLAGLGFGLATSILAQSRGGWLAIPLLVVVSLIAYIRMYRPGVATWFTLSATTLLAVVMLAQTPAVEYRVAEARQDLLGMTSGNFETSIGWRVLMWQTAWDTGREAPLFGQGFSGYPDNVDAGIEHGHLPHSMGLFRTEPHSDYLHLFASRGVVGLMSYAALLLVPIGYLIALLTFGERRQIAGAQLALSLLIVLAVSGLSITMIDQRAMIRFISVMSAIALYAVWETRRSSPPRDSLGRT